MSKTLPSTDKASPSQRSHVSSWMGLAVLLALSAMGCSDHSVVIGNVSSGLLVFGLFYTTLNLKCGEKKPPS